jgi:hypothetical protein
MYLHHLFVCLLREECMNQTEYWTKLDNMNVRYISRSVKQFQKYFRQNMEPLMNILNVFFV